MCVGGSSWRRFTVSLVVTLLLLFESLGDRG